MSIQDAFESFMSANFRSSVDKATVLSWRTDYYVIELFQSGDYRTFATTDRDTFYDSPGFYLFVPSLNDEEWNDDPSIRFYDSAESVMREKFEECFEDCRANLISPSL